MSEGGGSWRGEGVLTRLVFSVIHFTNLLIVFTPAATNQGSGHSFVLFSPSFVDNKPGKCGLCKKGDNTQTHTHKLPLSVLALA